MHSQLDDLFNTFFAGAPSTRSGQGMPALDIYTEDDKQLVAEAHVPGFDKKDVEVNVHNGVLEIKGEKHDKEEEKGKKKSYVIRESHSSFYRSVALPKYADGDNVKAHFKDGVLKVTIPFKELPAPKKVAIEDGKK
jgi:HSP20 family protein